jgi:hypothetical protein
MDAIKYAAIRKSFMGPLVLIGSIVFSSTVCAQQPSELMKLYFSEVQAGKYPSIPKQLSISENSKTVLNALPMYFQDTVAGVRSKAYTIAALAGNNARQVNVREQAVQQLLNGVNDKDGGNAGLALDYLTSFRRDDFTAASKDSVRNLFDRKPAHFDVLMKLVGFLELTDLKESIRPYSQPGNPQSTRWAAIVSLARMNDASAVEEMMRRVRKLPVNDDIIYKIFPDLAYTRHPEAIAYMVEAMQSDEKNCLTADAEKEESIPCGYRIMEQLAPVVDGYPLQLDESGDLKTKDYVEALKTVREWFVKHPDYKILRDKY